MATKSITVAEDAYEDLKSRKKEGESFSDVIRREFGRRPLTDLIGVIDTEEAEEMRRHISEDRKRFSEAEDRRTKQVSEALE